MINRSPIAVHPYVGKTRPIRVEVALRIFPKTASHSNPRFANNELANLSAHAASIFIDHIRRHSWKRSRERARFHWCEHVPLHDSSGDFCASGIIDDRQPTASDIFEEPHPRLGIPRFAAGMEFPQ